MIGFAVCLGAVLGVRLWLNDVKKFSVGDETVMCRLGLQAQDPNYRYRVACERWFSEPKEWIYPGILRFGNIFLLGTIFRVLRSNSFRVMTTVSAVAGILSVVLSWVLAKRLSPGTEVAAAALVGSSPLLLHVGRRALQDAQSVALCLAMIAAILYGHPVLGAISLACMLASKETTATHIPAIVAFLLVAHVTSMGIGVGVGLGMALYVGAFLLCGGRLSMLGKYRHAIQAARTDAYGRYQEGGLHRLFVDVAILSPCVLIAAAHARALNAPLVFALVLLVVHSMLPVLQSVRMVTTADVMLRIAAAGVIGWSWWLAAFVAVDVLVFVRGFLRSGIYDPVTVNLVSALGMTPKLNTEALNG